MYHTLDFHSNRRSGKLSRIFSSPTNTKHTHWLFFGVLRLHHKFQSISRCPPDEYRFRSQFLANENWKKLYSQKNRENKMQIDINPNVLHIPIYCWLKAWVRLRPSASRNIAREKEPYVRMEWGKMENCYGKRAPYQRGKYWETSFPGIPRWKLKETTRTTCVAFCVPGAFIIGLFIGISGRIIYNWSLHRVENVI